MNTAESVAESFKADASTLGWDTVFCLHMDEVNDAIAEAGTSPTDFSITPADSEGEFEVKGCFDHWQFRGGENRTVKLRLPVKAGQLALLGRNKHCDLAGVSIDLEVRLHFQKTQEHHLFKQDADNRAGEFHNLKVKHENAIDEALITGINGMEQHHLFANMFHALMSDWCNKHLGDFQHIFATVNLNERLDTEQFAWLKPQATSYAAASSEDGKDHWLGILCMTHGDDRQPSDNTELPYPQLSVGAVPPGSKSSFLISEKRILNNVLRPHIPWIFPGTRPRDFPLDESSGKAMINVAKGVAFHPIPPKDWDKAFKEHPFNAMKQKLEGAKYKVYIRELNIKVRTEDLELMHHTVVEISPGISAHCRQTSLHKFKLSPHPDKQGRQIIEITTEDSSTEAHWTEETQAIVIIKGVAKGAAGVLAGAVTAMTGGADIPIVASALLSAAAAGMLMSVASLPDFLELFGQNGAPTIDLLEINATDSVRWAGGKVFKFETITINQSLQIGGQLHPK